MPNFFERRLEHISEVPRNLTLLPKSIMAMCSLNKDELIGELFANKREYAQARWLHLQLGFYAHISMLVSLDALPGIILNGIPLSGIVLSQLASSRGLSRLVRLVTLDKFGKVMK